MPMPTNDATPEGYVKSILPCTPLAIIKILEHIGVYNRMLQYGDRARGKVITVINRCVLQLDRAGRSSRGTVMGRRRVGEEERGPGRDGMG